MRARGWITAAAVLVMVGVLATSTSTGQAALQAQANFDVFGAWVFAGSVDTGAAIALLAGLAGYRGGWLAVLRWGAIVLTIVLNTLTPALAGNGLAASLHAAPPVLLLVVVEVVGALVRPTTSSASTKTKDTKEGDGPGPSPSLVPAARTVQALQAVPDPYEAALRDWSTACVPTTDGPVPAIVPTAASSSPQDGPGVSDPMLPVVTSAVLALQEAGRNPSRDRVREHLKSTGHTIATGRLTDLLRTAKGALS